MNIANHIQRLQDILKEEDLTPFIKEVKSLSAEFRSFQEQQEASIEDDTVNNPEPEEKHKETSTEGIPTQDSKESPVLLDKTVVAELNQLFDTFNTKYKVQKEAQKAAELANIEAKKKILEEFRDLIQNEENLKKAFDRIKQIREEWKSIGEIKRDKYLELQNEYSKLSETFNYNINIYKELKEHDLKKNFSLKNQIVHELDALKGEKDIKTLEKNLTRLRNDWDEIGGTYKDKWEIIKEKYWTSVRTLHDKLNAHYEDQRKVQAENLERKKRLLEELKPLSAELPNDLKSWKKATDSILDLQKQWKSIGFSSRKETQPVWENFRGICNTFFDAKKNFFDSKKEKDNVFKTKKQVLVDKALELKGSKDWRDTSKAIIQLQKEWKKIGHAGPHAEHKLWKQFRSACDEFFNNKNAHYEELEAAFEQNIKAKQDYISRIANMEFPSDELALMDKVTTIGSEFAGLGDIPQAKQKHITEAFNKALQLKINALPLPEADKPDILFKSQVLGMKDAGDIRGLDNLKHALKKELTKLNEDINKMETNLSFFNISKGAESLLEDANKKIDLSKARVEIIRAQLKTINIASR